MTRARSPDAARPAASAWLGRASAAALALLALTLGTGASASSAAAPSFSVAPPSQTIAQNALGVSVDVVVNDAAGIAGWSFQLSYNPDVLAFVSAEADTTLLRKTGASDVYCPGAESDPAAGLVQLRCSALGGDKDAAGSAKVATIRFRPKAPGRSDVFFRRASFIDRGSNIIGAAANPGVIRVLGPGEAAGGVAPTPTVAAPTPTPPPPLTSTTTARVGGAVLAGTTARPGAASASDLRSTDTKHDPPWARYLGIATAAVGGVVIAIGIRARPRRQAAHSATPVGGGGHDANRRRFVLEGTVSEPEDSRSDDFFTQIEQRTEQMKATLANLKAGATTAGALPVAPDVRDAERQRHDDVSGAVAEGDANATFLSLLEQRTQQLKTALTNLEADKVRIEGLIAKLQPLVPQYDALVSAEQSLADAQVDVRDSRPHEPLEG